MLNILLLLASCGTAASFDLLLSSGFLCFSSHAGFMTALESSKLTPDAYVGTSSGSLAAAFAAAGLSADDIRKELGAQQPISLVRPSTKPWDGPLSTRALVRRLRSVPQLGCEDSLKIGGAPLLQLWRYCVLPKKNAPPKNINNPKRQF